MPIEFVNSQYFKIVDKMLSKSANPLQIQKDFQDFFRLPNFLLSNFGYDFLSKPRSRWSIILRFYLLIVLLCNFYIMAFITKAMYGIIVSDELDVSLLLRIISGFNYAIFATVKFMAFVWNVKPYRQILGTLKEIYPKTRKEKNIYRVYKHFWPKWILSVVYFYLGAVTFIIISPLLESIILYILDVLTDRTETAEFGYNKLYEIEYGFDHKGIFAYLITYSIELLHAHFAVVFNIGGDILLLSFTLQLCMHFDYIARTLESYEPNEEKFDKDQKFIAEFVKKHQILLNLSDALNKSFDVLLLLLLMSISATLCCAGVYALTQGLGRELIQYTAFLPIVTGQYFLICYYGQQLIIRSQCVAEAAYNNPWYSGSPSYKRSIFIIIIRSQKQAELNALGFQTICLEAFKMVMGATYRVFALVKETLL